MTIPMPTRMGASVVIAVAVTLIPSPAYADTQCGSTNGKIIVGEVMHMPDDYLAIGGRFTKVNGKPAKNLAVIHLPDCRLVWANTASIGTVYALGATAMRLFVGGESNFSLDLPSYRRNAWAPDVGKVHALAYDGSSAIFLGTGSEVRSVDVVTGKTRWSMRTDRGAVESLIYKMPEGVLVAGGLFEGMSGKPGSIAQHGAVMLQSDGVPIRSFAPRLPADSGQGEQGSYDGEEVLDIAWNGLTNQWILGTGSAHGNFIRTVNWAGAGPGDQFHHQLEGDVQAVAVVGGGHLVVGAGHQQHGTTPGNACTVSWLGRDSNGNLRSATGASIYSADVGGCAIGWDGGFYGETLTNDDDGMHGGVQDIQVSGGYTYFLGSFSHPGQSIARFSLN